MAFWGQNTIGFAIETASCSAGTFDIVLVGKVLNPPGAPNVFRDAQVHPQRLGTLRTR